MDMLIYGITAGNFERVLKPKNSQSTKIRKKRQ
jgi:hypothetical protein